MNDPSVHITGRIRRIGPAFGAVAAGALLCATAMPIHAQQDSAPADAPVATDNGEAELRAMRQERATLQAEMAAAREEAALKTEQIASLESETASLQTQLEAAQGELATAQEETAAATARLTDVRAAIERETQALQTRLSAIQQELAAVTADRDEIRAAGERELEALRARLPPDEGGTLDLAAARAAAGEQAQALREANQAMNRRGADRAALQATLDQAITQLHREQSLVNRIQGGTLYQVRTGDTLAIIAARLLGDTNQWPLVFEANRHVLENPDRVWPGTTLIVP